MTGAAHTLKVCACRGRHECNDELIFRRRANGELRRALAVEDARSGATSARKHASAREVVRRFTGVPPLLPLFRCVLRAGQRRDPCGAGQRGAAPFGARHRRGPLQGPQAPPPQRRAPASADPVAGGKKPSGASADGGRVGRADAGLPSGGGGGRRRIGAGVAGPAPEPVSGRRLDGGGEGFPRRAGGLLEVRGRHLGRRRHEAPQRRGIPGGTGDASRVARVVSAPTCCTSQDLVNV